MSRMILSVLFWILGVVLIAYGVALGGWALAIPASVAAAAALFAADLLHHRELVALDRDLARAFAHLMSAVAVAGTCMYWLARLLVGNS